MPSEYGVNVNGLYGAGKVGEDAVYCVSLVPAASCQLVWSIESPGIRDNHAIHVYAVSEDSLVFVG